MSKAGGCSSLMKHLTSLLSSNPPAISSNEESEENKGLDDSPFHDLFSNETINGLCLNDIYLPEEVIILMLSYVEINDMLEMSLVCRKWCNIVKSHRLWMIKYQRQFKKQPQVLPWYLYYCLFKTDYFDENLLKNGNGKDKFKHWVLVKNYGDGFRIENPPQGSDPLLADIPDFNGCKSCFATSYHDCSKLQIIQLNSQLLRYILKKHKPHIQVSEWVSGRFDCGSVYRLSFRMYHRDYKFSRSDFHKSSCHEQKAEWKVEQWAGKEWSKVEMLVKDYPDDIGMLIFYHEGHDTQFWKGHYGSKMAGGVVKILFNSINTIEL